MATVETQRPSLSPRALCVTLVVRTIFPDKRKAWRRESQASSGLNFKPKVEANMEAAKSSA